MHRDQGCGVQSFRKVVSSRTRRCGHPPLQYAKAEQGPLRHRAADKAVDEHFPNVAIPVTREGIKEAVARLPDLATTIEAAA